MSGGWGPKQQQARDWGDSRALTVWPLLTVDTTIRIGGGASYSHYVPHLFSTLYKRYPKWCRQHLFLPCSYFIRNVNFLSFFRLSQIKQTNSYTLSITYDPVTITKILFTYPSCFHSSTYKYQNWNISTSNYSLTKGYMYLILSIIHLLRSIKI